MPILLPREDEIVENTTSFHSVSYHRILQNAVVTSVVIATGKAMHKKVRRGGCFAAHHLFFSCAGFGLMVSRGGGRMLPISIVASTSFQYQCDSAAVVMENGTSGKYIRP